MIKQSIGFALAASLASINAHAFPAPQPVNILNEAEIQHFLATLPDEDFFIQKLTERIVSCECEGAEAWLEMTDYYNGLLDYYGYNYGETLRTYATTMGGLDHHNQEDVLLARMWQYYGIDDLFMPVFALIEEQEAYRLVDSGVLTSEQVYTAENIGR
ncbi:hypothetical protein ACT3OH_19355 [Vreelandella zhanjiangensis]|uniref:hypothetical protein n=1 Tax=Halomonas hibernica TaxID=2591147 RepID=UPI001551AF09|nr:hypothetical protein [Halomonas hibernica]